MNGKYHSATYVRRFGSWVNALEKAGLEKANPHNYRRKFTDEDLFKNLEIPPSTPHKIKRDKNQEIPQSALRKTKRGINWRLRFIVMRRDNFKCKGCGRSPATNSEIVLHVDHITPWIKGGETVLENLQTLCSICNLGKGDI